MGNNINRSLYYYDMELWNFNSAEDKLLPVEKFKECIIKIFNELLIMQKKEEKEGRIIQTDNGDNVFAIIDDIKDDAIEFKMILSRADALPFIEMDGTLESLANYIKNNQNLAELTHCVIFPSYKVLGMEYNFAGAKSRAIREYFSRVSSSVDMVDCVPKLNLDTYSKIIENESFTLMDFAIKNDSKVYNEMLSKKSVFNVWHRAVPDAETIQIILKKRKKKSNQYKGFNSFLSNEEIKELITTYRDDIQRFVVSQGAITDDSIDLLSDKLVNKVTLLKTEDRIIDSEHLYKETKDFFKNTVRDHCKKEKE